MKTQLKKLIDDYGEAVKWKEIAQERGGPEDWEETEKEEKRAYNALLGFIDKHINSTNLDPKGYYDIDYEGCDRDCDNCEMDECPDFDEPTQNQVSRFCVGDVDCLFCGKPSTECKCFSFPEGV